MFLSLQPQDIIDLVIVGYKISHSNRVCNKYTEARSFILFDRTSVIKVSEFRDANFAVRDKIANRIVSLNERFSQSMKWIVVRFKQIQSQK